MDIKKEIQSLIDAYQQQIDAYEHEQQLIGGQLCCNETTITLAKQFIGNLNDILIKCK